MGYLNEDVGSLELNIGKQIACFLCLLFSVVVCSSLSISPSEFSFLYLILTHLCLLSNII
jgi:hypothetical protein